MLLPVNEVAERLRCRPETIRKYIATGLLPAVKLPSGYYRVREVDLETFLEQARKSS